VKSTDPENLLVRKTAELAGLILIAEISPPKAPKAPPIAVYLAVPFTSWVENLRASVIS
jgi:hypothetical protein